MSGFAAELAGRAGGFLADVERELAGWEVERRRRWETLGGRVRTLTIQLTVALDAMRRQLGAVRQPRREQVGEILTWVVAFERERRRIEDEVWTLVRATRAEDEVWRRAVAGKAAELDGIVRRLGREADDALAEATVSEAAAFRETEHGQALGGEMRRVVARMRGRLESYGAELDAALERMGARGVPDFARALARFDAVMAEKLGGGAGAAAPRRAVVPRVVKPKRKQAKIPKFLISKFYKVGNLRQREGRVELTFSNPIGFCIVQGGDAVLVDGKPFPKERTVLDGGDKRVLGSELSDKSYLKFPRGGSIVVVLEGLTLGPGRHHLACALELRKMGWVELDVKDTAG